MNGALNRVGRLVLSVPSAAMTRPRRRFAAGLAAALCLALPIGRSIAQTPTDDVAGAVQAALAKWIAAFNRADPTAAYFASDAVMVRGNGTFSGSSVINDMEQKESRAGLRLTLVVEQVQALSPTTAIAVSRYTVTPPGAPAAPIPGVSMHTLQRVGDRWQVRAASFTRTLAPPSVAAAAASAAK